MVLFDALIRLFRRAALGVALCAAGASYVNASPSRCPDHYWQGNPPLALDEEVYASARELCSTGYSVWYSGAARSPIFAAEYLSPARVARAYDRDARAGDFRPDLRLPRSIRAELYDYRGSGYDRGHLAPSGDMGTAQADSETFLLTNIVPQDPQLNRNLWAAVEKAVRALARHRSVFVVTGVLWMAHDNATVGHGRVRVPAYLYKLVYDVDRNAAAAYLVANAPGRRHRQISLAELQELAGLEFFPSVRQPSLLKLPRPRY